MQSNFQLGLVPTTAHAYSALNGGGGGNNIPSLNHNQNMGGVAGSSTTTCDCITVRHDLERLSQNVMNRLRVQDEAIEQISRKSDRLYDKLIGKNELAYDKILQEFKKTMSILSNVSVEIKSVTQKVESSTNNAAMKLAVGQVSNPFYGVKPGISIVAAPKPKLSTSTQNKQPSLTTDGADHSANPADEDDDDMSEYQLVGILESEEALKQWMIVNGPLSKRNSRQRKFGPVIRYQCGKRTLYGGCPIQIKIRNHVEKKEIEIYKRGEHCHDETKVKGIPPSMKTVIEECSNQGMGPTKIHQILSDMQPHEFPHLEVPTVACISNVVCRLRMLRRKKMGIPPRPFMPSANPRKRKKRATGNPIGRPRKNARSELAASSKSILLAPEDDNNSLLNNINNGNPVLESNGATTLASTAVARQQLAELIGTLPNNNIKLMPSSSLTSSVTGGVHQQHQHFDRLAATVSGLTDSFSGGGLSSSNAPVTVSVSAQHQLTAQQLNQLQIDSSSVASLTSSLVVAPPPPPTTSAYHQQQHQSQPVFNVDGFNGLVFGVFPNTAPM